HGLLQRPLVRVAGHQHALQRGEQNHASHGRSQPPRRRYPAERVKIGNYRSNPDHGERVRQPCQHSQRRRRNNALPRWMPEETQNPETETRGQIEIQESKVKYESIGEHAEPRREEPWAPSRGRLNRKKSAPKEKH